MSEIRYSFSIENTKVLYQCWKEKIKPIEPDYDFNDFLAQLDSLKRLNLYKNPTR